MHRLSAGRMVRIFACRVRLRECARLSALLVGTWLCQAAGPARAIEGDTLRPFIDFSLGTDSNLFRFADDAQAQLAFGEPIRSISYQRYGAGVDLDWKQGRQRVTGRLAADKTRFSSHADLLDYTGQDLKGAWNWQLGNRWSGVLSASRKRTQSPYSDNSGSTVSNVSTVDSQVFQAEYWFHSDWRARFRLDQSDRQYSVAARKAYDSNSRTATFGLYRQGGTLERLGVEWLDSRYEYPNRLSTATLDNRSNEQSLRLVGSWSPTGKSTLSGLFGFAQRAHPNVSNHDYSGLEWQLTGRWLPTGKTLLEATLSRDLRVSEETSVNYVLVDGLNLAASWQALAKIRVIGQGGVEHIAYEGHSRKDKTLSASLSANYEIWRGGDLSVGAQYSSRGSNVASREYDSTMLFVSTHLQF